MIDYEANRRAKIASDPEYAARRRAQKKLARDRDRITLRPGRELRRREQGATYFTGKPCKRGHISPRYAGNQTCVACTQEQQMRAEAARRERMKSQPGFAAHRRAQRAASSRASNKKHRDRKNAEWAKWHADRLQRTPKWADLKAIRAVYTAARRVTRLTGVEHHVDHIVPMRGKLVSGLHIAENLRVLPGPENLAKGSKFMP